MIKLPIIIDEHGDISIFLSVAEACDYLEPIDVKNNEYSAYDSEGRCLKLGIASEPTKGLFGRPSNKEKIQFNPSSVTDSSGLSLKLRLFLEKIGNPVSVETTLAELVKILKEATNL